MHLCLPYTPYLVHPLWIFTWKEGCPCVSLHEWPSHLIFVATPCLECVQLQDMNLCPPGCLCLVHSLCIVWWKPGCPCMAVCLCPSHLISVATPCLECVWASVHEFMPTLHPMSGPPPMDSYMEHWVPLCVTACVSQSPYFCCYTLFRMCTCISTWIYVYLTLHIWSTPYGYLHGKKGAPVCHCMSDPVTLFLLLHLV